MKKTIPWLLATIALLPSVLAQSPLQLVAGMFERTLGFLFVGGMGATNFVFWGKFLLWILLFAVFTYAGGFVFKEKKNIRITVAGIIALISVVAMPGSIVRLIFEDYGIIVSFFMLAIPLLATIFFLETLLPRLMPDKGRAYYGIKAAGYYLLGFVITHIGRVSNLAFDPNFRNIWSFAAGVSFILFLWNLIRCIMGGGGEKGPDGGGGFLDKFRNLFNKKPEVEAEAIPGAPGSPERVTLARAINKVGKDVDRFIGKTREIVHRPIMPAGRPITMAILDLYHIWLTDPTRAGLETNLNIQYDELGEKMHEMNIAADAISDQFEAILRHPRFAEIGDGEKAMLASHMNRMVRGYSVYADGLLMFYSQMAEAGR